MFLILPRLNRT